MNTTNLTGRLTKDPERDSTTSGTPVCKLRLASEDSRQGNVFVDVVSYGKGAQAAAELLHKGDLIGVEGELRLDEWTDKETQSPRSRLFVVGHIHFLALRGGQDATEQARAATTPAPPDDDVDIEF